MNKLLFVLALISLSFAARIISLPYQHEYFILSDILWTVVIIKMFFDSLLSHKWKFEIHHTLYKPIMFFSFLVLLGSFITVFHRGQDREILSLQLWGPFIFYGFRYTLFILSFAAIFHWLKQTNNLILGMKIILITGFVVEIIVISQALGIIPDFWPQEDMAEPLYHVGPLSNHHAHIGGYLLILLGLTMQVLVSNRKIMPNSFLLLIIVLTVPCLLISGKRSGWAAIILFFLLSVIYSPSIQLTRKRLYIYVISIVILIGMFYYIRENPALNRAVYELYDFETGSIVRGGNLEGRLDATVAYLQYFVQQPMNYLFGTGFASTFTYVVIYAGTYYKKLGGPHNQFVSILFELGIPGLLMYIWVLVAMIKIPILEVNKIVKPMQSSASIVINTIVTLIFYSIGGAILFVGTSYGNLTLLLFVYYALAIRYIEHEKVSPHLI